YLVFNATASPDTSTLSLHDALPILIAGVFIALLSPTDGAVNQIQTAMGFAPINYMTNTGTIRWVLVISEIWRSAGWDSLLYLARSEEHTSELQSRENLVCRLLREKK